MVPSEGLQFRFKEGRISLGSPDVIRLLIVKMVKTVVCKPNAKKKRKKRDVPDHGDGEDATPGQDFRKISKGTGSGNGKRPKKQTIKLDDEAINPAADDEDAEDKKREVRWLDAAFLLVRESGSGFGTKVFFEDELSHQLLRFALLFMLDKSIHIGPCHKIGKWSRLAIALTKYAEGRRKLRTSAATTNDFMQEISKVLEGGSDIGVGTTAWAWVDIYEPFKNVLQEMVSKADNCTRLANFLEENDVEFPFIMLPVNQVAQRTLYQHFKMLKAAAPGQLCEFVQQLAVFIWPILKPEWVKFGSAASTVRHEQGERKELHPDAQKFFSSVETLGGFLNVRTELVFAMLEFFSTVKAAVVGGITGDQVAGMYQDAAAFVQGDCLVAFESVSLQGWVDWWVASPLCQHCKLCSNLGTRAYFAATCGSAGYLGPVDQRHRKDGGGQDC